MNNFIVADPNRCIGCRTCEIACALAHLPEDALRTGSIDQGFNPRLRVVKTRTISVPIQCRHCEDAPCANVCPSRGIVNKDNTIQINPDACIGCKNCIVACPFGAIEFAPQMVASETLQQTGLKVVDEDGDASNKDRIVALKCDLCINRAEGPACAGICPTDAFKPIGGAIISRNIKKKRNACAEEMSRVSFK